jgi:hypothetical protein
MGGTRYLNVFVALTLAACSSDLATAPDRTQTRTAAGADVAAREPALSGTAESLGAGMVHDSAGVLDVVELADGSVGVRERARVAVLGLETPGYGPYACDPLFLDWLADWPASFVGKTKYQAAAYAHVLAGSFTFYPGAPVYYGTNTNSVTYLGSCNGSTEALTMEIHRRISGVWTKILTATVHTGEKYTFYSGVPAGYRAVLRSPSQRTVDHYGYGAAWTLSPPLKTP